MNCACINRLKYFAPHPDEEFNMILDSLSFKDKSSEFHLYQCDVCKQLYAIDKISRGPLIVKIDSVETFYNFDEIPYRKLIFTELNGGVSDRVCLQANCKNYSLGDIVFCLEHAYPW